VLYRTIVLMSIAWILVTGIILALLVTTSWLGVERLGPVSQHAAYYSELDSVHDALAERFISHVSLSAKDRRFIAESADALESLGRDSAALAKGSSALIGEAVGALRASAADDRESNPGNSTHPFSEALRLVRKTLRAEVAAHQTLLRELADYGDRQLLASGILALVIPVATVAFLVFFRRRVLAPLNDLSYLMGVLSRKDYGAAMTEDVDPLMAPLFARYNRMVKRMRDLDAGHTKREGALQQDVGEAARALIQQQAVLARAERMAAVGDVAARLAHDLRNPLSGVLVALTNLQGEVDSVEQSDHLGIVIRELEHISRLLNDLVDESRQVPERPQRLQLRSIIEDLIRLLRYQLDAGIAIKTTVPETIHCRFPESGFRNVLLNLMLNAAQAIGDRPGTIEIAAAVKGERVELTISDDGPGFPEDLLKAGVYEHGTWRKGGTGFGLATARRFALEHGSSLELRSGPNGGATVILRFPVEDCHE